MAKRNTARASIGRMVSLLAFLPVASRVPDYARLIGALVLDERMPAEDAREGASAFVEKRKPVFKHR